MRLPRRRQVLLFGFDARGVATLSHHSELESVRRGFCNSFSFALFCGRLCIILFLLLPIAAVHHALLLFPITSIDRAAALALLPLLFGRVRVQAVLVVVFVTIATTNGVAVCVLLPGLLIRC